MIAHGKHVRIDADNPDAVALCDRSGLPCNRRDLVKQMEWRGDRVVWTGLWVNKRYADPLNRQDGNMKGDTDPDPLPYTRPDDAGFNQAFLILETGDENLWFLNTGETAGRMQITLRWK